LARKVKKKIHKDHDIEGFFIGLALKQRLPSPGSFPRLRQIQDMKCPQAVILRHLKGTLCFQKRLARFAEHWGLTEQIFRVLIVFTLQKKHDLQPNIKGCEFLLTKIPESNLFGLKSIWRGQIKVSISDPSRTIIDLLNTPKLGGGIRPVADILCNYLKSEYKNTTLLIEYAKKLNNGAVYKRLGFLLEHYAPEEKYLIEICKKSITRGNSKLDPQMEKANLATRWHLWLLFKLF